MAKVILTKGLPGSGKDFWATGMMEKHPGRFKRVNKDMIRAMVDNSVFSPQYEKLVIQIRDLVIERALRAGYDVIVSDTNLHPKHERHIRSLVNGKATVEVVYLDVDVQVCVDRDAKREGRAHVGEKVIRGMAKDWEKWKHEDTSIALPEQEVIEFNPALPTAIMCDLDGTLAHMTNRSPYEWKRCIEDTCDEAVKETLWLFHEAGYQIVLMSGRDAECRAETEQWLKNNHVYYDALFMRPEGDMRKDSIIKRELFDAHVRGKYNILFVLDDRNQVVDEWRLMGLKCFQVAEGAF
jgi:predicted kinase